MCHVERTTDAVATERLTDYRAWSSLVGEVLA